MTTHMKTADLFKSNATFVYLLLPTLSILLSIYSVLSNDVINKDGTLYIYTAEAFLNGGLSEAMGIFSWPFFSITIAIFHVITGASLELSAYSVNAIYLALLTMACVQIYEEINTKSLPLWLPALLILALPIVNDYRIYVVRGHGFWAFTLLALLFFIRYNKQPNIRNAILWQTFAIIGTLFRIEGVIFLALAPLYFLYQSSSRRAFVQHFLKLNSFLIPAAIAATIALFSYAMSPGNISGDLQLRLSYMLPSSLTSALTNIAADIQGLMPRLSSGESTLLVTSGLIALVCYKIIKNINLAYLAIWFIGRRRQWIQLSQESTIVLYFAFISILPLIVLAGNHFFMSSRYTVLTVILFSLVAYQYVEILFYRLANKQRYFAVSALAVLAILFFLDGIIHTGANKGNMTEASRWLIQNIEPNKSVACNEGRLLFYTNKRCTHKVGLERKGVEAAKKIIQNGKYDYFLLWIDHKHKKMQNYLSTNKRLTLIKSFSNKKQDEVSIYQIQPN